DDDDDDDDDDPDPWPARPWPGDDPPLKPSIDPQGYVYEGVPSNRLAGVTATVYYKELAEDQNGNPVEDVIQWDAESFGQINPQITGTDGMYQWFVPKGLWQVKVEKEGYETAYSEWLPVPPPQLDVNIAMKQSSAPEVKDTKAYEEGINITFDKYMLPALLTTDNISVLQDGDPVEGSIELQDKEEGAKGDTLVSKVRFVPETPFTQNKVTLCINRNVQSYAYMLMPKDYQQELDVELEVKELKTDSLLKVTYGESTTMSIKALPVAAAAGKTVRAKVANDIVTVNDTILVLCEQGETQLEVAGRLPGATSITFTLEGTDLTTQTIVHVKEKPVYPVVATPVASLASESTVEAGTQVTLTCETENARIWYTLDGSCPCVSGNRILYTEPIVLQEGDITLKVMADAEGYDESEVATYIYHVVVSSSIITISSVLYDTYVAPFDVDITSNDSVKAYAVTSIYDGWVTITETPTVPAGEAVVVSADEAGSYRVKKTTDATITTNLLKAATEDIEADEANRLYVLTNDVDGVGFYPVIVGKAIPAGKGYLEVTVAGVKFYAISEITDDMKGLVIESLDGTRTIYNLSGQRIEKSKSSNHKLPHGIYIINNKKTMIK
ncbi:MAG: chitobiase/beta-hexosaminidase C-terminal domain-containing protein, partial [Bacteroidaceae bacterium]|nr:chitobiase/beta-hexosaminidase C-terminal domain-containing protein [Bacteroidaceae bacterium]